MTRSRSDESEQRLLHQKGFSNKTIKEKYIKKIIIKNQKLFCNLFLPVNTLTEDHLQALVEHRLDLNEV